MIDLKALVAEILDALNAGSLEGLRPVSIHPQQLAEWRERAGITADGGGGRDAKA